MIDCKFTFVKQGKQNQSFQSNWLTYCKLYNGGFCEYYALFASTGEVKECQVIL